MNKKNVQAFTLMELLAVLVILAIIALIVFPIIGDVITDSKMKAFKSSVDGLEHAVDLDYQKDYYKGEREYSYEDGNLTLNSVKGESKNKNIKVEGIIENGAGTVSVDKDGNTSLMIYNDEYCATKSYNDKIIKVEEKTNRNCKGITPEYCFDTEEVDVIESYDINLENCKKMVSSDISLSEADKTAFCTKGQTTSDGYSLEIHIADYYDLETLTEQSVIENVTYKHGLGITGYKCYEGNEFGYETVTEVVLPEKINNEYVLATGYGSFRYQGLTSLVLSNSITMIGPNSFAENNLTEIFIPKNVKWLMVGAFSCNPIDEETGIIYEDEEDIPILGTGVFQCVRD